MDIEVVENFHTARDKSLCILALKVLTKSYPKYMWACASPDVAGVMIKVSQLSSVLGDCQGMYVNPKSWSCLPEFEKVVVKVGGELLERAGLIRGTFNDTCVTATPEGFDPKYNEHLKLSRFKLSPTDALVLKDHLRMQGL